MTYRYTSGAEVLPVGAPRRFRPRFDRRGFEPLDAGPLPEPDYPQGTWELDGTELPVWRGEPTSCLVVDLTRGGLGDAVRQFAIIAAILRSGRVDRVVVVANPGRPLEWLKIALAPLEVVPTGEPVVADAVLPPLFLIPGLLWWRWPIAPLTATVAHSLNLPIQLLAGPCCNVHAPELDQIAKRMYAGGWEGQPVIAVQTNGHSVGPPLTRALHHEKVPKPLEEAIPRLVARGHFVLRVGSVPARGERLDGVLDLGGGSITEMAAALFLADLAMTGDSAPLHLAAAVGTPVVALFGPSDPRLHVCAAGTQPISPPPSSCPVLPCGAGSMLGGPTLSDHATRVPLPCPPAGGCLSRLTGADLARALDIVLGAMRPVGSTPHPRGPS